MDTQQAFAGLRSAIEQGADVGQFVKAITRSRDDALAVGGALGHIADHALAGATVTVDPQFETLFKLRGAARRSYLGAMTDEQLGAAVGQLAMAVGQVPNIKFDAPTAPPPLRVAIVAQPETVTESTVEREGDRITRTRQVTRPVT